METRPQWHVAFLCPQNGDRWVLRLTPVQMGTLLGIHHRGGQSGACGYLRVWFLWSATPGVDRGTCSGRRVLRVSPGQVCCLLTVLCPSWMLW